MDSPEILDKKACFVRHVTSLSDKNITSGKQMMLENRHAIIREIVIKIFLDNPFVDFCKYFGLKTCSYSSSPDKAEFSSKRIQWTHWFFYCENSDYTFMKPIVTGDDEYVKAA